MYSYDVVFNALTVVPIKKFWLPNGWELNKKQSNGLGLPAKKAIPLASLVTLQVNDKRSNKYITNQYDRWDLLKPFFYWLFHPELGYLVPKYLILHIKQKPFQKEAFKNLFLSYNNYYDVFMDSNRPITRAALKGGGLKQLFFCKTNLVRIILA
jgi:hypothetical protein